MGIFLPQQYGCAGHETFRIPIGRQQAQNRLFKRSYWHNSAAKKKPSLTPSARSLLQRKRMSSAVIETASRMNQKQRVWNRANACCASASFSGVVSGASMRDGSFMVTH